MLQIVQALQLLDLQDAQNLVVEAIKSAAPERKFEANNYFPMVQVRAARWLQFQHQVLGCRALHTKAGACQIRCVLIGRMCTCHTTIVLV